MDPVSQVLADRESNPPRLLPWVVLATVLHGLVVGAAFAYGRATAARPAHLPVVSVRLIRPERPPGRPAAASQPRPNVAAATPRPVPAATPIPAPAATPAPRREPTAATRSRASDKAMAAPDATAPPVPTEAAEPEPAGGGSGTGGSGGLSLGEGDGGQVAGVPADFHFSYYIERMLALIESRWYKPAVADGNPGAGPLPHPARRPPRCDRNRGELGPPELRSSSAARTLRVEPAAALAAGLH